MSQDRRKIQNFLDDLKQEPWLGEQREWWPDYLFHFTAIENAVSILNSGFLFSRDEVERRRIDFTDSASSKIISQTDATLTDYVRLYFRPRTPTTYHMEGFKPLGQLFQGAHCPVPVYFLFDMREIITLRDTRFSNGNLASRMISIFASADEFIRLPFEAIYEEEKRHITTPKQAEVIHPKKIPLDYLKHIVCRSQAEYETLRNLLSSDDWKRWESKVCVRNPHSSRTIFHKLWLHIGHVSLAQKSIEINFISPSVPNYYGPFKISCYIQDILTGESHWLKREYADIVAELDDAKFWDFSDKNISNYIIKVFINDNLAYTRRSDDIPF